MTPSIFWTCFLDNVLIYPIFFNANAYAYECHSQKFENFIQLYTLSNRNNKEKEKQKQITKPSNLL